ncbi:hypothetical protein H6F47_07855 [Sphaerospermopsis sp. FACHB-1094]|nr:hypothetical protein [Sphaerospermopsis sp. FACHB-1094]MBD2132346.1 hypothetical protein [Sphaerospermopsis sp. FACHB-1094]
MIYQGFRFIQQTLVTYYQLPITNYQLPITNHQLPNKTFHIQFFYGF